MKKVSTAAGQQSRKFSQQKLTIGLDLGDRNSWYCVLDEAGQIGQEQRVRTTAKALGEAFGAMPRSRIALEIGGAATGAGPVAISHRRAEPTHLRVQRTNRSAGTTEAADAHQQRRRPLSANTAGAGGATHLGTVWHRL